MSAERAPAQGAPNADAAAKHRPVENTARIDLFVGKAIAEGQVAPVHAEAEAPHAEPDPSPYNAAGLIADAQSMCEGYDHGARLDKLRDNADPDTNAEFAAILEHDHDASVRTVGEGSETAKKSVATVLMDLAEQQWEFGCTPEGVAWASPRSGPKIVATLRGGRSSLRTHLAKLYREKTGRVASQAALADALLAIEGKGNDSDPVALHMRVAEVDGVTWIDLGDATGEVVRVDENGWEIYTHAPVMFERTALSAALPRPVRGGNIDDLWLRLNVAEADRPLLLAFMVAAFNPSIPHPILELTGEQGTGKTTALKTIVSLLDPSPVPTRQPPRDDSTWSIIARASWLVGLDNVSTIAPWLSDSLCRAVTGDGMAVRKLYSDGDLHVVAFRRVVIITGIDLGAIRGDLAERLLRIELAVIPPGARLGETELDDQWEASQPGLFGALLDLVAGVAGMNMALPSLEQKPRMADFAKVCALLDQVRATESLARYMSMQTLIASESLTGDLFVTAMIDKLKAPFSGTSKDLLALIPTPDRPPKGWPANARQVTSILKRSAPQLRKLGWQISDDGGANKGGVTAWKIGTPEPENQGAIDEDHYADYIGP